MLIDAPESTIVLTRTHPGVMCSFHMQPPPKFPLISGGASCRSGASGLSLPRGCRATAWAEGGATLCNGSGSDPEPLGVGGLESSQCDTGDKGLPRVGVTGDESHWSKNCSPSGVRAEGVRDGVTGAESHWTVTKFLRATSGGTNRTPPPLCGGSSALTGG